MKHHTSDHFYGVTALSACNDVYTMLYKGLSPTDDVHAGPVAADPAGNLFSRHHNMCRGFLVYSPSTQTIIFGEIL